MFSEIIDFEIEALLALPPIRLPVYNGAASELALSSPNSAVDLRQIMVFSLKRMI